MQIDNKTIKKLGLAAGVCILFAWLLANLQGVGGVFATLWGIFFPFTLGFILAFFLNIPMSAIENRFLKKMKQKKRRILGFILTLVLVLAVLLFVVFLVVPALVATIATLGRAMPAYVTQMEKSLKPYLDYLPMVEQWVNQLNVDWESLLQQLSAMVGNGAGNVLSSAVDVASSIASGFFSFFIGLIFACYLLLDKEHLTAQLQGLLKAWLPISKYERLAGLGRLVSHTYVKFISGQCIEAVLLGIIYIVALTIGGFQYSLLIGVIVGFTTLIPMIGAFLGCLIGVFLLLVSMGFWRTVAFVILFLIIQQLEGSFIYPRVVGSSVGLPPIWIMLAVIVGGGLAGIFGALFFIPLFSVVYTLLHRKTLRRLAEKGIASPVEGLPKPPPKAGENKFKIKSLFKKSSDDSDDHHTDL